MAYRYAGDNTAVKALRTEPCTSVEDAKLTNAVNNAEDKVDLYLAAHNVVTPVTGAKITDDLKEAVAQMAVACLYYSNQLSEIGKSEEALANAILDKYLAGTDVDKGTPGDHPTTVNYQEKFVDDWNEPNDAAENMDV